MLVPVQVQFYPFHFSAIRRKTYMLKIFLCDDDPFFLSLERDLITRFIREDKFSVEIAGMAGSLSEALNFFENNSGSYLIFLDLDFGTGQLNGMDISAALKRCKAETHVVFTTNHYDLAMDVLKSGTEPFGFLEKGSDIKRLAEDLRRYIQMALRIEKSSLETQDYICFNLGCNETAKICVSDILYLEAEKNLSHGITYHTINGSKITIISTLDTESTRLGSGFLRVHRSYLAAKSQILALRDGYLVLSNRTEIPCSLRMRSEVKKWLNKN